MNKTFTGFDGSKHAFRCLNFLRVVSLNLGTNVQRNLLEGSEKVMVARCNRASTDCAQNAAKWICDKGASLAALQEGPYSDRFVETLKDRGYTLFNKGTVGVAVCVPGCAECEELYSVPSAKAAKAVHPSLRGVVAVYLPDIELVFVSLWLNHDEDKVQAIEILDKPLRKVLGSRPCSRVILGMDSNDDRGELLGKSVRLLGKKVFNAARKGSLTCCEDSDYKYPGDYIFDSAEGTVMQLGPSGKQQLMSDHMAVFADVQFKPVVYFSDRAQLVPKQPAGVPVMAVSLPDWQVMLERAHEGAFGEDHQEFPGPSKSTWVAVWKFPYDIFQMHNGVRAIPAWLPVGTYGLVADEWARKTIQPVSDVQSYNQAVTKWRYTPATGPSVHFLQSESRCIPCIASHYWARPPKGVRPGDWDEYWDDYDTSVFKHVRDRLQRELRINAFPCHEQHHVLVLYSETMPNNERVPLTVQRLDTVLRNKKTGEAFVKALAGPDKDAERALLEWKQTWLSPDRPVLPSNMAGAQTDVEFEGCPLLALEPLAAEVVSCSTDTGRPRKQLGKDYPMLTTSVRNWSQRWKLWPEIKPTAKWWINDKKKKNNDNSNKRATDLWDKLWCLALDPELTDLRPVGVVSHSTLLRTMLGVDKIDNAEELRVEMFRVMQPDETGQGEQAYDVWDRDRLKKKPQGTWWKALPADQNHNQRFFSVQGSDTGARRRVYFYHPEKATVTEVEFPHEIASRPITQALSVRFVRHAQSVANASKEYDAGVDTRLSPTGEQQAKELQPILGGCKLVLLSPLSRAIQTGLIALGLLPPEAGNPRDHTGYRKRAQHESSSKPAELRWCVATCVQFLTADPSQKHTESIPAHPGVSKGTWAEAREIVQGDFLDAVRRVVPFLQANEAHGVGKCVVQEGSKIVKLPNKRYERLYKLLQAMLGKSFGVEAGRWGWPQHISAGDPWKQPWKGEINYRLRADNKLGFFESSDPRVYWVTVPAQLLVDGQWCDTWDGYHDHFHTSIARVWRT